MNNLTNDELIKVQGGAVIATFSYYLLKRFIKFVAKNLKLLAN